MMVQRYTSCKKIMIMALRDDPLSHVPRGKSALLNLISLIVLHVLDILLLIILLPFMIWKWVSANDRLKIVLKAMAEVTLELLVWVILAGVSVLTTAMFILEDSYFRGNDSEKPKQSPKEQNGSTSNNNDKNSPIADTQNLSRE